MESQWPFEWQQRKHTFNHREHPYIRKTNIAFLLFGFHVCINFIAHIKNHAMIYFIVNGDILVVVENDLPSTSPLNLMKRTVSRSVM